MQFDKIINEISKTEDTVDDSDIKRILQKFLDKITSLLKENDDVKLFKFGRFFVKQYPERKGFNPRTRQKIIVSARRKVIFLPYGELKKL